MTAEKLKPAKLGLKIMMREDLSSKEGEETKEVFSQWDELYASGRTPWETDRPASQLVAYVTARSVAGLNCVETCCGTGASSVYLAQQGAKLVVGVDVSSRAIELAKLRAEAAGVSDRCRFVMRDLLQVRSGLDLGEDMPHQFDLAFDCQGFQLFWNTNAEAVSAAAAGLVAAGGTVVAVAGNANEYRAYEGGGSLTVAELVGLLSPPAFALESLVETRFDAGEIGQDKSEGLPPLAWFGVFIRTASSATTATTVSLSSSKEDSVEGGRRTKSPTAVMRRTRVSSRHRSSATEPPVIARKLSWFGPDEPSEEAGSAAGDMDDAVDAALSVDGSVAPSDCGSDATSAFAGADGFENIAASRAAAARAERARAEGDVPWVRWWDRRAKAYDTLCAAQPVLDRLARRVAKAGLHWAFNYDSASLRPANDEDDDHSLEQLTLDDGDESARDEDVAIRCVDLAAGTGQCVWAVADYVHQLHKMPPPALRADLIEPSHAMAALARARAASLCRSSGLNATVWQISAERCQDRLPPRLQASVDLVTCSASVDCINYHDVLDAAASLLRPGGALAFDLTAGGYEGTADDDTTSAWLAAVRGALADRGLLDALAANAHSTDSEQQQQQAKSAMLDAAIAKVRSRPPVRPPVSVSSLATAASATGLRLAECRVYSDVVPGDFFVAYRAMSTSWLAEPFAGMSKLDAKHLRSVVLLDAANRAARNTAKLRTALFVVVKPSARVHAALSKIYLRDQNAEDDHAVRPSDPPASRPITQSINDDHFAPAGPAKV